MCGASTFEGCGRECKNSEGSQENRQVIKPTGKTIEIEKSKRQAVQPQLKGRRGIPEEERKKGMKKKTENSIHIQQGRGNGRETRKVGQYQSPDNQVEEAARRDWEGSPSSILDLDEHQTSGVHQIRHICQQVDTRQDGHRQSSVPVTHHVGLHIIVRAGWIH